MRTCSTVTRPRWLLGEIDGDLQRLRRRRREVVRHENLPKRGGHADPRFNFLPRATVENHASTREAGDGSLASDGKLGTGFRSRRNRVAVPAIGTASSLARPVAQLLQHDSVEGEIRLGAKELRDVHYVQPHDLRAERSVRAGAALKPTLNALEVGDERVERSTRVERPRPRTPGAVGRPESIAPDRHVAGAVRGDRHGSRHHVEDMGTRERARRAARSTT